jgi:hypothetical protein
MKLFRALQGVALGSVMAGFALSPAAYAETICNDAAAGAALKNGSIEALQEYLSSHPEGACVDLVVQRLAELAPAAGTTTSPPSPPASEGRSEVENHEPPGGAY